MAMLGMDSFDHYATADLTQKWAQIASAPTHAPAVGAYGRNSTSGVRWDVSGGSSNRCGKSLYYTPKVTPSGAVCIPGFAFKHGDAGFTNLTTATGADPNGGGTTAAVILYVLQGGSTQVYFRLNTTGYIQAYRGDNTLLGTATAPLLQDTYHFLEFKITIDDTAGAIEIRKDGATVLSLTATDTKNTSSATWDQVAIGHIANLLASAMTWSYDDFRVMDGTGSQCNDFLGDRRVGATLVTGDGASTQFTPLSGSNYQNVDESSADGATTYNESSTVGHIDTFTHGAVPLAGATVDAVQLVCQGLKTDAGTVGHKGVLRISSTNYKSSELNPASSYAFLCSIWELNPASSASWTTAVVDAMEVGYEKSS